MAKFRGKVGFLIPQDDQTTGIATEVPVEKLFYGKILEHTRRWDNGDHVNDDLTVANQISIVATDYAFQYMSAIRYVYFMGSAWTVTSMRVKHPEIILTLGGVWNGPKQTT